MDFGGVLIILGFAVLLGFIGFVVYFISKHLEFVIKAINLYEKMITRQDVMIKLLKDIRGTEGKKYDDDDLLLKSEEGASSSERYAGIGVSKTDCGKNGAKIYSFTTVSPARAAGVKVNDIMVEIDGVPVTGKSHMSKLRGVVGSMVKIKVLRDKGGFKEFEIERQTII